jgi:uncharacterized membrane protein
LFRIGIVLLAILAAPFVVLFYVPVMLSETAARKCAPRFNQRCRKFFCGFLGFMLGLILNVVAIPLFLIAALPLLLYLIVKFVRYRMEMNDVYKRKYEERKARRGKNRNLMGDMTLIDDDLENPPLRRMRRLYS